MSAAQPRQWDQYPKCSLQAWRSELLPASSPGGTPHPAPLPEHAAPLCLSVARIWPSSLRQPGPKAQRPRCSEELSTPGSHLLQWGRQDLAALQPKR